MRGVSDRGRRDFREFRPRGGYRGGFDRDRYSARGGFREDRRGGFSSRPYPDRRGMLFIMARKSVLLLPLFWVKHLHSFVLTSWYLVSVYYICIF